MSKRIDSSARSRGETLLGEWGVEPHDVAALRGAWGRELAADAAIVDLLGGMESNDAAAALVDLEPNTNDKALRKEIRRALFRLEQRGIEIPKKVEAPAVVTVGGPEVEGYLSASDGNGDLLVWLVKPRRGELLQFFAVVNDPLGMREADLNVVTRKLLRAACDDLRAKHDIHVVETDWRYCDHRMSEAHRWAAERGETVDGDYLGMRNQLLKSPPVAAPHPILSVFDAESIRADAAAVADSDLLLEGKELRTWFLTAEQMAPYLEELDQIKNSPLVLNEAQQRERLEQIVARALEQIFGGNAGESFRRRLLDLAWVFHATKRREAARRAFAVAMALEARPGGRGIPFCEALVRSSLTAHANAASAAEQERHRESLILTPREAALQAAQRRGR